MTDRAQAEEKERRKPKTKKAKTLSKKVFERLQKAQELLGEDKHGEAMTELQAILDRGSRLKPYERAVTLAIWKQIGKTIPRPWLPSNRHWLLKTACRTKPRSI
ncbi:MAG: hypothetical protein ACPG06_03920 [Alphaproteobacteria bacterium]